MNQNCWDLSIFFSNQEEFELALKEFKAKGDELASYKGKLHEESCLCEFLKKSKETEKLFARLYFYAEMLSDRDKKNVENATLLRKVQLAVASFSEALSFQEPELIEIGEEKINSFLAKHKEFDEYSFYFEKLFRGQRHILSKDKEKLLSSYSPLLGEAGTLYSQLTVADYKPKKVILSDGKEIEVNMSNWTSLIAQTKKEEDRAAIFESLYSYYDEHKSVYGEIYNLNLQSQLAVMKSRGYSSILESHLYGNAIPKEVFTNLIDVASNGSEPLKKYYKLRQKALGLTAHRSYDRFLHLAEADKKYSYDEAKQLFFDSLSSFPKDFQEKAREVLKEGYVDVYPGPGKRTGAYSNGGYDYHPFILLNFMGELNDVFTLAHEAGHSIHTLYSEEAQPTLKQDYTIFVAEIASTFNEHNLLDYLLTHEKLSRKDKIFLLQKAIDEICSTFYRQTLFAHYEYEVSKLAENGQPINYQGLSEIMVRLYKTYYGIDIEEEKVKPLVWAYIPHLFYSPFYVYQYATSFTSSMLIYERVKNKEEGAFEQYINLLRSGGSDFPVEQVKRAGVDLTSKEPFLAVIRRMEDLVNQLEAILEEKR